jgi:hypothetical protein
MATAKTSPAAPAPVTTSVKKASIKKAVVKKTPTKTAQAKAPRPVKTVKAPAPKKAKAVKAVKTAKPVKTVKPVKSVKVEKPKKPKLVRDSFTIPKAEYLVLDELKQRATKLTRQVKKSELLRAGIKSLAALSDAAFLAALEQVPAIKTGRPASDK